VLWRVGSVSVLSAVKLTVYTVFASRLVGSMSVVLITTPA
jgi:hypothetical protein